jgi:MFS superfamily sulfate permease-like transporter
VSHTDLKLHSASELEAARTKGQVIGWVQGAGAMLVLGVAMSLIGWIPTIVVGALIVVVVAKLISR